jgi:cytochrome c oxidase subunit 2
MEGLINFHHDLMFFLIAIVVFTSWIVLRSVMRFNNKEHAVPATFVHGTSIEIAWTLLPAFILFTIALPSFSLLYSMDEIINPAMTVKVIGHQWYWVYEYSDTEETLTFESYMVPEADLEKGQFRLLEVDNRLILPTGVHIRILITASDVLHSWAIPSLGVKLDACPGRLNQTSIFLKRAGIFYGQCSEICGINHGFMPIVIEGLDFDKYKEWADAA